MRRRVFSWLLITGLILGFYGRISAQEILLDRGIKAGKLDCFPVYGDEKTFYYLPANPRLATIDGKPQFSFIKYVKNVPRGGEGGTTEGEGGGLVHFLVLYGATDQERAEAEQEIQRQVAGAHLVGPVIYRTGTFALVTSFRKENDELAKEVVGMGKAPIMEGHKASVSMHLTQKGATLLWESFRNPTSQISVTFEMEARGYRNPYEATLEADWKKISNSHRVSVGAKYKWLGVDVDLLFQEFRKTGALKLEVKGKSEEMDKIWQKAFDILMKQMFEKDETLDALSSLQKGDSGFNNLNRAMDFLKKEQERKAKEKKGSASLPMSMLERPVLTWPSDAAGYGYLEGESAVQMAGPYDDEALEQRLDFIGSGFSPAKISGRSNGTEEKIKKAKESFNKGKEYYKEGLYKEAIEEFENAYKEYPLPEIIFNIGVAYEKIAGKGENSEENYKKAVDYLEESIEGFKEGKYDPKDIKDAEEKIAKIESIVKAREFFYEGNDLFNQEKYYEAAEKCLESFDIIPKPRIFYYIAICYDNAGNDYGNIEDFIKARDYSEKFLGFARRTREDWEKKRRQIQWAEDSLQFYNFLFSKTEGRKKIDKKEFQEIFKEWEMQMEEAGQTGEISQRRRPREISPIRRQMEEEDFRQYLARESKKGEEKPLRQEIKEIEVPPKETKKKVTPEIKELPVTTEQKEKKPPLIKEEQKKENKKAPPAAKAKPADKKKAPAKQPKKAEKGKGDESSPGFAIIASYRMRRIKHSGKAVINLNQWTQESLVFRFDENIGGLSKYIDNPSFFRAVNLDDPVYKQREVVVMLDGQDSEDFSKYINYVTVQIRKEHENGKLTHDELKIDRNNFNSDTNRFMMMYGWKGDNNRDKWLEYGYRTQWSFYGGVQKQEDWKNSNDFVITVTPPHKYRRVILETDPSVFKDRGVRDASIKFYSNFYGKEMVKQVTIRTRENVFTKELEYAHPEGDFDYEYEITWHLRGGVVLKSERLKSSSDVIYCDELPAEDKTLY